mgnify:CR=1 FL=1
MTTATPITTAQLSGDTYGVRDILKAHGWSWDADSKTWNKAADWKNEAEVISFVRGYGGIRNRGSFSAELV